MTVTTVSTFAVTSTDAIESLVASPTFSRAKIVQVLNASYQPLSPVRVKRAIALLISGRAEVVEEHPSGQWIVNAGQDQLWPLPLRIRLLEMVKVAFTALYGERGAPWTKTGVLRRDAHRCGYCLAYGANTVDHIRPVSRGGRSTWLNTVAACSECNGRKADLTLEQAFDRYGMKPLATPYVVRRR